MELVHGAKSVMFPLCCEYGLLSSQPLHVAIQFSAFQIHVQFYRKKWWMYHVDPAYTIMLYCLHFIADDWGVLYKVDRHRNTNTHTHTHTNTVDKLWALQLPLRCLPQQSCWQWLTNGVEECALSQLWGRPIYAWSKLLDNWLVPSIIHSVYIL